MNRAQRRAAQHKRGQRYDRNDSANPAAALAAIAWSRDLDETESATLSNDVRLAWHHLTNGSGTTRHFDELCNAMNVALIRAEQISNGELAVEAVKRAMQALLAMRERYTRLERFGADAQALLEVPVALDFYDDLLRLSTPLQMHLALKESLSRMRRGQGLELEEMR